MKSAFLLSVLMGLMLPVAARAQNTTVTATVTDPNSSPYAFATGYAALVCPGNQAPLFNGFSMPRSFPITGFDGTGTFTQVLYDVNSITPAGCGYQFHITYKDGVTTFITGTITSVTGSSVNLSTAISAFAVLLPAQPQVTNPGGATGTIQYNNSGTFGGILGTTVTPSTGATTFTATSASDTPLSVSTSFSSPTKPIADFNVDSSTAGLGTINFRGIGTGNWSDGGGPILVHFMADGNSAVGWMVSNNASGYNGNGSPRGAMAVSCNGVTAICTLNSGGNDANGNYAPIIFDAIGKGITLGNSENNNTGLSAILTVETAQTLTHHDIQQWQNSCATTCVTVSGIDQFGNAYWNGSSSGKALIGASATGGQAVYSVNGGTSFPIPQEICTGQIALSTGAINSGARATNTLSCSGLSASTDSISCTFSGDTNAVTGYAPSASGGITLKTWASTNTINVDQVNNTGGSITPGAATINCKGIR